MARPGNVVNTLNDLKAINVGFPPFEDGFNCFVKDPIGDGSILPLQYIWLNRPSVVSGLKIIKPNNNNGGWYLMQILGDQLPAIDASTLSGEGANYYRDRANHTGSQPVNTITGLGNAALLNVGNAAGTVAAGDDARFGQATNALSFDGQPSSYFLNRANHTGNIPLTSLDLLTGYSVGSAVAINATDSVLSAFGKTQAQLNNKPELVGGLIPSSMLPSYVDDVLEYANLTAFPVSGESGKLYIATDTNLVYRWTGSTYAATSSALALGETSSTAYRGDRGKTAYDHSQIISGNPHGVTKSDVGLGNCNNTSDANKPVSSAQQTALDLKANAANPAFTGTATGLTATMVGLGNLTNDTQVKVSGNQTISGIKNFTDSIVVPITGMPLGNCWGRELTHGSQNYSYTNAPFGAFFAFSYTGAPTVPNNQYYGAKWGLGSEAGLSNYDAQLLIGRSSFNVFIQWNENGTVSNTKQVLLARTLLSAVVTWNIPSTAANGAASQDFTVTGAVVNDFCDVAALDDAWFTLGYNGFLSASVVSSNTVRLRWCSPPSTVDPISATFRILVIGF